MSRRPKPKPKPKASPEAFNPPPPAHLGEVGQVFFSETLAHLQRLKVMHPHNLIALETMAEAYETYRMHLATVQAQGCTLVDAKGVTRPAPWYKMMTETRKELRLHLVEFGLTPASLTKQARLITP
jgi:P27 family predicted phage terminase small subunit